MKKTLALAFLPHALLDFALTPVLAQTSTPEQMMTPALTLGYFCWIGAFSPGVEPKALSDEFKNALKDPNKINKNLLLFDIVTGDHDAIVGKYVTEFEARLKQANVEHVYTVLPGGTHSMFVWRPALHNFLQEIFKH